MYRVSTALLIATGLMTAGQAAAADWIGDTTSFGLRGAYVHVGIAATKQADEGTLTMGGAPVAGADFTTDLNASPVIEAGVILRNGFGFSASGTFPMSTTNIGAGTLAGFGNLATETIGFYSATAQYHFMPDEIVSPYVGAGIGYMHVFGTQDALITGLVLNNAVGGVLQAGVNINLSRNVGAFIDVKRYFLSTTATGSVGPLAVVANTTVDPWVVSAGTSFNF